MMLRFLQLSLFMRTFAILAASALLLAVAVADVPLRLWGDDRLLLGLFAFFALFLQGWLGSRVLTTPAAATPAPTRQNNRGNQKKTDNRPARAEKKKDDKPRQPRKSEAPSGPRESGTVKWFNRSKGFGFIVRENGEEIFVHQRSIRSEGGGSDARRPNLRDGQSVSFVVVEREKGQQAEDVTPESQA